MSKTFSALAPAKINLTLRVVRRRPDGYHDIESLVARLAWGDEVIVRAAAPGMLALEVDDPTIPAGDTNLALRSARLLAERTRIAAGAHIVLRKRIPAGAGLGGGSSDAATTLQLLNQLWRLGLRSDELARLGADLGSDVPLFLHAPVCVLRGRGNDVEDLPHRLAGHVVLVLPPLTCSTPAVYAEWDRAGESRAHTPLEAVLDALTRPDELMNLVFNDLEAPAFRIAPGVAELTVRIRTLTGHKVAMSGSGAALFRLFAEREVADDFAQRVTEALSVRTVVTAAAGAE